VTQSDPESASAPEPDEPAGGETACDLHRVCDACGALEDGPVPPVCVRCGAPRAG
jgi:hypothetical protein